jgi:hypothetical protein
MGNNSSFWEIVNKTEAIKILSKLGESDFYNKASFNIISAKMFHDQFSLK